MYISPGYLCDDTSRVAWVLACGDGYRRPEPVRLADWFVALYKKTGRFCGGLQ